jgi:hypothetical protein
MRVAGATDVKSYLEGLPADRRAMIEKVRAMVSKNVPRGIEEMFDYGMITWVVPLSIQPDTYNGKPLMFAALASRKNNCTVYLTGVAGDKKVEGRLRDGFKRAGKRLSMGKSCIHFKTLDDLPLPVIAEAISATSTQRFLEIHDAARGKRKNAGAR